MLSDRSVCLSVTLVYCSQTVGWMKMPLGKEVVRIDLSATSQLVTQSTRHKRAHNKATSCNFFLLHASQVAPRDSAQHGRRTYGKRTHNKTHAMPCSSLWFFGFNVCNIEVTDDGEALECDEC